MGPHPANDVMNAWEMKNPLQQIRADEGGMTWLVNLQDLLVKLIFADTTTCVLEIHIVFWLVVYLPLWKIW
jgi:hypothetical protein